MKRVPAQVFVLPAVFVAGGVFAVWTGVGRQDARGTVLVVLGGIVLLSSLAFVGVVVVRVRRGTVPEGDPPRPGWLDSSAMFVFLGLAAVWWVYLLVRALAASAYGAAALDALLLGFTLWTLVQGLRRRRRQRTPR